MLLSQRILEEGATWTCDERKVALKICFKSLKRYLLGEPGENQESFVRLADNNTEIWIKT
jgi:hypothetical protein